MEAFFEDQQFCNLNTKLNPLVKGEYESCDFENCDLSDADLSEFIFENCEFKSCNLSLAKLSKTAFRSVKFTDCKLVGLHFEYCKTLQLSVSFENCVLNLSSFYTIKCRDLKFRNCNMHEVDFTEADLSNLELTNCDLSGAIFDNTNLEKTDFRTAINYVINPELNRIKKAKFSLGGVQGLLYQYQIEIEP